MRLGRRCGEGALDPDVSQRLEDGERTDTRVDRCRVRTGHHLCDVAAHPRGTPEVRPLCTTTAASRVTGVVCKLRDVVDVSR